MKLWYKAEDEGFSDDGKCWADVRKACEVNKAGYGVA